MVEEIPVLLLLLLLILRWGLVTAGDLPIHHLLVGVSLSHLVSCLVLDYSVGVEERRLLVCLGLETILLFPCEYELIGIHGFEGGSLLEELLISGSQLNLHL